MSQKPGKSYETFSRVFGSDRSYGVFNGEYKEQDADFVFSTNVTVLPFYNTKVPNETCENPRFSVGFSFFHCYKSAAGCYSLPKRGQIRIISPCDRVKFRDRINDLLPLHSVFFLLA